MPRPHVQPNLPFDLFVAIRMEKDTVRVESGALAFYRGDIIMDARIPTLGTMVSASLSEERAVRPTLTGSGEVVLESSVGGFHVLELRGEEWIVERGAYWASDDEVSVGVFRERAMNAFWSGDGFIDFHTRVRGHGRLVLTCRGPAQEITIPALGVMAMSKPGLVTEIPFDRNKSNLTWSADGRYIYFTSPSNGGTPVYKAEMKTKKVEQLTPYESGIGSFDVVGNRMIFTKTEITNPSELYLADANAAQQLRRRAAGEAEQQQGGGAEHEHGHRLRARAPLQQQVLAHGGHDLGQATSGQRAPE